MKGFYSIWSKPFHNQKPKDEFFLHDYEMLTLLLSVGAFQKSNGPTAMYADYEAKEYLHRVGLNNLFIDGIHLMEVPDEIDSDIFWAAGKLVALNRITEPRVMIDLDLIIWKNIEPFLMDSDIAIIHKEDVTPGIYPDWHQFKVKSDYQFHKEWKSEIRPANTALLYIKDMKFKNYYTTEALRFMDAYQGVKDNLCPMVFAEQRMLALCADEQMLEISEFFSYMDVLDEQNTFTHIWGHKNVLRFNIEERMNYCMRCVQRIRTEYPNVYPFVVKQEELQEYVKRMEDR